MDQYHDYLLEAILTEEQLQHLNAQTIHGTVMRGAKPLPRHLRIESAWIELPDGSLRLTEVSLVRSDPRAAHPADDREATPQ